jgi:hypothetical protein
MSGDIKIRMFNGRFGALIHPLGLHRFRICDGDFAASSTAEKIILI